MFDRTDLPDLPAVPCAYPHPDSPIRGHHAAWVAAKAMLEALPPWRAGVERAASRRRRSGRLRQSRDGRRLSRRVGAGAGTRSGSGGSRTGRPASHPVLAGGIGDRTLSHQPDAVAQVHDAGALRANLRSGVMRWHWPSEGTRCISLVFLFQHASGQDRMV